MSSIVGRKKETERLDRALSEKEAQLIIVYGRRRVGKTYLIDEYFEGRFDFKFVGSFNQSTKEQLKNFSNELNRYTDQKRKSPNDWTEAFYELRDYLDSKDCEEKQVVFFDEMPWLDRQKSGFLPAFEWFWNSWGSSRKNLVFIVCGSATSWMVEKLDNNRGGLFNRQTCRLYLEPFSLSETELFLKSRNIYWSRYDIVLCYMIMGGIPFYLRLLNPDLSFSENIDNIFFRKRAELWDEFEHLYFTLFSNSEQYIKIAEALSKKKKGLKREEIVKITGLHANGNLTKMLDNLEKSGFIRKNNEYGNKKKEITYQLSDYYSMFYFRFLKDNYGKDEHFWTNTADNPSRTVWAGLTFEQVCKDHINEIKNKLGIRGVLTEISSWQKKNDDSSDGTQIDLLIDRRDKVINLCEIKFVSGPYEINKEYDIQLRNKVNIFRSVTKTNKTIQLTMITTYGLKRNMYSNYVAKEICMDDLFEKG